MASSSTCSPTSRQWKYDVFISFRGKDVRDCFLSHLFNALSQNSIRPFKDENLDRGEEISPALLRVIEESNVALIIFSENYADSPWCLDELVKIVDCKRTMGQIVVPIFYHVDPTDVQELTGSFGEAFKGLIREEFKPKTESWRNALRETAEISGFDSRNVKPESELIKEIVRLIHEILKDAFSYASIDDGLIGIDSRVNDIESKLCIGSTDVWFLGIWGMGGIGKTTIASKIYEKISSKFENAYFVANVREKLEKYTLDDLQHKIQSELLGNEMSTSRRRSPYIWKCMKAKKVLIVLDDVSDPKQIEVLIGKHDMYGPGSRVIITSRDKQILMNGGADEICEVEELNYRAALRLLSLHAFKQNSPLEEYTKVAEKVVAYAKGIPLALKVLGSTLYKKQIREWEDQLEKLEVMADKKIEKILKISYDELDHMEQEIFLDIACFFKGEDRHHAESILQGCGCNAIIGIGVLLNKALITISENNKLDMHDLLQQMGRDIVRKESIEEPWNCSRLWAPQDICNVLTKDLGEVCVKSITLDILKAGDINMSSTVFTRMKRLRLLKFYNPYYPTFLFWRKYTTGLLDFLPDELRYLYWFGYPSKSLPLKFSPKNLVQLYLVRSHVEQLCINDQCFESLKLMDLSYSVNLIKIADLSKFPKLEVLNLSFCTSLIEIRSSRLYDNELQRLDLRSCTRLCYFPSFLNLERLEFLSLEDCSNITEFPMISSSIKCLILSKTAVKQVPSSIEHCTQLTKLELISCTNLLSLPNNIGELQLLQHLNLDGCSNLKELPVNIGNLKSLTELNAAGSGIRILPSTINCLVKLVTLDCSGCRDLILPPFTGLPSLEVLDLTGCGLSEISDSVGNLKSLDELYLDGNDLKKLPVTIKQLPELRELHLSHNKRLKYLPELPSTIDGLFVDDCTCSEPISFTEIKIMDDMLLAIEFFLPQIRHGLFEYAVVNKEYNHDQVLVSCLRIDFRLVGDELPSRMKYKNENGSSIFISMEQYEPLDFMVIVFSAVLVASTEFYEAPSSEFLDKYGIDKWCIYDPKISCESRFVTESGSSLNQSCSEMINDILYTSRHVYSNFKNNMIWAYSFGFGDKQIRFTEASFQFLERSKCLFRVKKCGVHILCSRNSYVPPFSFSSFHSQFYSTSFSHELD